MINVKNCEIGDNNYFNFSFSYTGVDILKNIEVKITDMENNLIVHKSLFNGMYNGVNYWIGLPPLLALNLGKIQIEFPIFNIVFDYDFCRPTIFTVFGEKFTPVTNNDMSFTTFIEVKVDEVYSRGHIKVEPGDVVLDIGSNYGFFSLYAIEKGASQIIALEPFDPTFKCLVENTKQFDKIATLNLAIADVEGESEFTTNIDYSGCNYLSNKTITGGEFSNPEKYIVKTTTINKIIDDYKLDKIDFLKVDCEGGELDLFKTISDENLSKVQKTVIEYHSKEIGEFVKNKLENSGMIIYNPQPILDLGLIYAYKPKPLKIGILLSAYNSENYIDECLEPWFKLKKDHDIVIGCNSGMYKEYVNFGFKPKNKETLVKLLNYDLDFLISTGPNSLLDENDSKNNILDILKDKCDLVWILDSDEFYTENDIINIIKYISENPQFDWYSVNFKNYTFSKNLWVEGFCPPRIFRTNRNGGINKFYFDNHINYNDGSAFDDKPNSSIPRNIAHIKHYCWLDDDTRSKEKVKYQEQRFTNGCSFEWLENENRLIFSDKHYGLETPILHEMIDKETKTITK